MSRKNMDWSFWDSVWFIGAIFVVLYFTLIPYMLETIPTADTMGLEIWFLIGGGLLLVIGILGRIAQAKISR